MEPRRKDRAMESIHEMELLLKSMAVGRLAVSTRDGPYIVAVNFLFFEDCIYFHSGLSGRKIKALRTDPRVCFFVDEVGPQVIWKEGCGLSQIYKSVVCFGKVQFLEDSTEKRRILEQMIQKYVPSSYQVTPMDNRNVEMTAVIKIVIDSMSGKKNGLSPSHTVLKNRF